ncbi:hypothetical protein JCM8097_004978 [Rhodosporidiobolus ruineniae]
MNPPPTASTSGGHGSPPITPRLVASPSSLQSHYPPSSPTSTAPTSQPSVDQKEASDGGRKGRNLVLFFDGTGNTFGKTYTNIPALFSLASKEPSQLCYYQTGIGTVIETHDTPLSLTKLWRKTQRGVDFLLAWSLGTHIQKGYQFLMNIAYQKGDSIFLFGFSRGAYTARALAGMLESVGLLPPNNEESVSLAYSIYKQKPPAVLYKQELLRDKFKQTFSRAVTVNFVGVFDTVSSVGAIHRRKLPFAGHSRSIDHFRQALALDERRVRYAPEHWHQHDDDVKENIKEVWFVGSHSNVGGGQFDYDADSSPRLSHLPLLWMLREAMEQGLQLDADNVKSSPLFKKYFPVSSQAEETREANEAMPELSAFIASAKEKNPSLDESVAKAVYLASCKESGDFRKDATAHRVDHLCCCVEKSEEPKKPSGSACKRRIWWLLEGSKRPQPRTSKSGTTGQSKDKTTGDKLRVFFSSFSPSVKRNWGRGRQLPPQPSFHRSVEVRIKAPAAFRSQRRCAATCGREAYVPAARFQPGEDLDGVHYED